MDDNESRQLLIDSGVPEEMIDRDALNIASIIGDAVIAVCTKKIAGHLIADGTAQVHPRARICALPLATTRDQS